MGWMVRGIMLLAAAATAAHAAEPKKAPPTTQTATHKQEARLMMRDYTECLVKTVETAKTRKTFITLMTKPDGSVSKKDFDALVVQACLVSDDGAFGYYSELTFQQSLMRGSIFRALYLELQRNRRNFLTPAELAPAWADADPGRRATQRFGDCVVSLDPEGADRAIRLVPTSGPEAEAYAALAPALNRCVVEGSTIKFSKSVIEGILAEALYKKAAGIAVPAVAG